MTALAKISSNCKRQTHPVVREDITEDYNRKGSVEKDAGRGSQGACHQDELNDEKPPVVK
jgi:hypothetical protein